VEPAGPYGRPFHPALVVVPLGAWLCSLALDVMSRVVEHPDFMTNVARWLIAIGVLGALAAAVTGLVDFLGIPSGTHAFRAGLRHMIMNLMVTSSYAVNFLWRLGDEPSHGVSWGQLALAAVTLSVMAVSATLGSRLAYFGVSIEEVRRAKGRSED
jgi:uncharacterized membrane protein